MADRDLKLGWIGTGVMGAAMCGHLLDAGFRVTVHSRTKERAAELLEKGAVWAERPADAAAGADVVMAIVGYPEDVREVFFGADGVLAGARPGTTLVDLTTSEPALATELAERAATAGCEALDAPVSGGDVGAREARLSIMVGGEAAALERVRPLLEVIGSNVAHQGPAGAGQHTKMVNQVLIASAVVGVCEGLLYAYRAGLDVEATIAAVAGGAAGSWQLDNYGPRMLANDWAPGFVVEHFVKDMGIALEEARRMKLALPGLALANQLYVALEAQGEGGSGTQALIHALARLSALDWDRRTGLATDPGVA